ncbi:MAG: glycosyltransferase [Microgenomates group bacterium Gr01-1014_16]|nr:MAG: glycosyltransferase [Microgenomates group bacterium Gr01-1014_16]
MTKSHRGSIAVVSKYFYPVAAGIEVNVLETYSVLAGLGWDVTIYTSRDTLTEKSVLPQTDNIRGLKVIRYPFANDYFGYVPEINWKSVDVVCLHNFNVFHFWILLYVGWFKLLGRKKFALIVTPHGAFNPEWSIYPKWSMAFPKQLYHYIIGTFFMNTVADKMRAVSNWERQEIINKGVHPDKVEVISNGLEDEAYQDIDSLASSQIKDRVKKIGRYLIQIGRVYPIKNYETVIKALPDIPSDVKFIIAGPIESNYNDTYYAALKDLISNLHLENRVIFWGVIRGVDKYYLIKHAQMMVHMALWESFCNVVHEGMSQGLVCIVANNTALPYLVKNGVNGYLIDTHDYVSLARKINYTLDPKNSREIKLIQSYNTKHGRDNSWRQVALKMDKLYKNL